MDEPTHTSKIQTPTLPDDIIFEQILPKLPVKPLFRFKSVSKLWLSTISTPQFAKSHLKQFTSQSSQFLISSGNRYPDLSFPSVTLDEHGGDEDPLFTSVTLDEHGRVEESLSLKFNFDGGRIHVVGCSNGLVCFIDRNDNFYICNPVTQQCSDVINCPVNTPDFPRIKAMIAGFGYVSSVDDYKIACLIGSTNNETFDHINQLVYYVCIFSLRNWKWEITMPGKIINILRISISIPILVNDVMYWGMPFDKYIVRLNLVNAEISIIPLTIEGMFTSRKLYDIVRFVRINGELCLCDVRNVWRLNPDGLSWSKMYVLNCKGLRLLCVSEDGKWLVLKGNRVGLLDPSKSFSRQYEGGTRFIGPIVKKWDYNMRAWNYKMSLVSPFLDPIN